MSLYRDGQKIVWDTGESPRDFQGVLSVVYAGTAARDLVETVYPTDELRTLPRIDPSSLEPEIRNALGKLGMSVEVSKASTPPPASVQHIADSQAALLGWRAEYREAMAGIWEPWALLFTPMVIIVLPYILVPTILWSVVALGCLVAERVGGCDI